MKAFLEGKQQCDAGAEPTPKWNQWHAPHERTQGERAAAAEPSGDSGVGIVALLKQLSAAVPLCRARRQELSLLLVESNCPNVLATADKDATLAACGRRSSDVVPDRTATATSKCCRSPRCSWRRSCRIASGGRRWRWPTKCSPSSATLAEQDDAPPAVHTATLSAGVATVAAVPKNFDPWRLVESAERCLYAARSCNTNAVKSIEI